MINRNIRRGQHSTEFKALASLCENLSVTNKRNFMVNLVANFLTRLEAEEIEPAVSMILGRPLPKLERRTLDVSWRMLNSVLKSLMRNRLHGLSAEFRKTGDIGSAIKTLLQKNPIRRQVMLFEKNLSILETRSIFEIISQITGSGAREKKDRMIGSLLARATPIEAKYLVKILIGEMRTGFQEGLMEFAVSKAFSLPLDKVRIASMFTGDIAQVAKVCIKEGKEGLLRLGFQVFKPIKPMLAQVAETVEEALKEHGGETSFEYKLDGARIQIHKSGKTIRIFSRRLKDVTKSLPEIVDLAQKQLKSIQAILEGEVIAFSRDGTPLPFQHLMRRFGKIYDISKTMLDIPVKLYLFDVLYVDGQSLAETPYIERRIKLCEIAGEIFLTKQIKTSNTQKAESFMKEAIEMGHEGLIAKRLESCYTPGKRGKNWLKIKELLEPLDLVIVAAEYGYGRRHNWLSDYYLAARNENNGEFLVVGKTFKGLTDSELEEMTIRLKELKVGDKGSRIMVKPKIVVEVVYNEIQLSSKYKSKMALRFARITRIRDDKSAEESDTIQRVRSIYKKQFGKKTCY